MISDVSDKMVIFTIYKNLEIVARQTVANMGLSIEVVEVTSDNYIDKAIEYKNRGKEIIISRGMIGEVIRDFVDINVISINITGFDLLKALQKFKGSNEPIAVLCHNATIGNEARKIGELLDLDLHIFSFEDTTLGKKAMETPNKILEVLNIDGIKNIIGLSLGDDTILMYKNAGINYSLIDSEEISIREAIDKAIYLLQMTMNERLYSERLKTIIEHSGEGIITIDVNGIINTVNWKSSNILKTNKNHIIGENIDTIIPELGITGILKSRKVVKEKIIRYKGIHIIVNCVPIKIDSSIIGYLVTLNETKEIQDIEQKIRLSLAKTGFTTKYSFENIIGKSNKMRRVIDKAQMYSGSQSNVLITGETGTGKEVLAQAIHHGSSRRERAFVAVNCSALPPNLLESELFGYSEGAFTGARKGGKQGLFELAHNGTIFLDEIGEIDRSIQAKLLRVIQEKEIMRVGDDKIIPIDIRFIAATNKDLFEMVGKGDFRMDLYFRLNILDLQIPPLRERKEDINDLVYEILSQLCAELNYKITNFDENILNLFRSYNWPGNVRELRNVLEKLAVMTKSSSINYEDVKIELEYFKRNIDKSNNNLNKDLEMIENEHILKILKEENFNKSRAAIRLGINRSTLNRKISKLRQY